MATPNELFVRPGVTGLKKLIHYHSNSMPDQHPRKSARLATYDRQRKYNKIEEEFNETYSPAQMAQCAVWKATEQARHEARRRRGIDKHRTTFASMAAMGVEVPSVATQSLFTEDSDVKVPELTAEVTYSIERVLSMRDTLLELIETTKINGESIIDRLGTHYTEYVAKLVPKFAKVIGADQGVVEQSLHAMARQFNEGYVSWGEWRSICWRMSGCRNQLLRRLPCTERPRLIEVEWSPIVVEFCVPSVSPDNVRGFLFSLRVLGGSLAGTVVTHWFSHKAIWYMHKTIFGLPRVPSDKKATMYNFLGMRAWVLLEPTYSPTFAYANATTATTKFNRTIYDGRGKPCPKGLNITCFNCKHGVSQCPLATHARAVVAKPCRYCGQADAEFYAGDGLEIGCISCRTKFKYRKDKENVGRFER